MKIRVLVADDQSVVRKGLRTVLDVAADIEVVGEAGSGAEAVEWASMLRPDVVLMDVHMPGGSGIDATRELAELTDPEVRVLVVTTFDLDEYVFDSLHAGASGFVLKDIEPESLIEAVRAVHEGRTILDPSVTGRVVDEFVRLAFPDDQEPGAPIAPAPRTEACTTTVLVDDLSTRERDVVAQLAKGRSNAEIARMLQLSETTVKTHVSSVLTKWGLRDRVQLVVRAFQSGLVSPSLDESGS